MRARLTALLEFHPLKNCEHFFLSADNSCAIFPEAVSTLARYPRLSRQACSTADEVSLLNLEFTDKLIGV